MAGSTHGHAWGASMSTFFAEFFELDPQALEDYGAFNISLVNDLPLFIDPFLLFHSSKSEYRNIHDEILRYLLFLRDRSTEGLVSDDLLRAWYCFPEVKQNWFGFSLVGNGGSGLGIDFARILHANLNRLFRDVDGQSITHGRHLEKVALITDGVGKDNISDFTTNLIKAFLYGYTESFALARISPARRKRVAISRVRFNYETEAWDHAVFELPWADGDHVLLTPKDMLTRDENWINRSDLVRGFEEIPASIGDAELRAQISNYFYSALSRPRGRPISHKERDDAARATISHFPAVLDYYIRFKEE